MRHNRNLLLFLFFFAIAAVPAQAAEVQSCSPDITRESPNTPWDQVYITRGDDGSAWQRAILNQPESTIIIREGEPLTIKGTAQPGQPVQVFVYGTDNDPTTVERPSAGVCFQVATADPASGFFSVELDATLFWPNIGKEVILDAFSRMDKNWDQLKREKTDAEFYIGTHDLPKTVKVTSDPVQNRANEMAGRLASTATCRPVCGNRNFVEGVFLDPANAPYPDITKAFDAVGSRAISLARNEGGHTRYTGVDGGNGDAKALRDITYKALSLELVKQALLGILKTETKIPSIGTLDAATLEAAAATPNSIPALLKTIMTDPGSAPTAAAKIAKIISQNGKTNEKYLATSLIGALPTTATPATWAEQFVNSVAYWTGLPGPNSCLMLSDGLEFKNFTLNAFKQAIDCQAESLNAPNAEGSILDQLPPPPAPPSQQTSTAPQPATGQQPTQPTTGTGEQTQPGPGNLPPPPPPVGGNMPPLGTTPSGGNTGGTPQTPQTPQTPGTPPNQYQYVGGRSPRVVLSTLDEAQLTPVFDGIAITYSQKDFDQAQEYWTLPAGKKGIFYYRYVFTEQYDGGFIGSACLKKTDVSDYVTDLAEQFRLTDTEQKALQAELHTGLVDEEAFYGLRIASPADITRRFAWKNGAKDLNLFRIFFTADEGACAATDFGTVDTERAADDGFETGLLN